MLTFLPPVLEIQYPSPMVWFDLLPGDRLSVRFPYREDYVAAIKRLPDRKWDEKEKVWDVPLESLEKVAKIFDRPLETIPEKVRKAYEEISSQGVRLLVDNTFTRIQGVDLPVEALDEVTSFWMEGAEYSKLYQDGRWDGHRHLMTKRRGIRVPTGLLPTVANRLTELGVEFVTKDLRKVPEIQEPLQTHGHTLRDYQKDVLEVTRKRENGILQLATGAGKTLVAAHIIASRGLRTLFFVHTKDLLYQAVRVLEETLAIPIGQVGDGVVDLQPITVATIQTAARSLHIKIAKQSSDDVPVWKDEASEAIALSDMEAVAQSLSECEMAIFDECHHLPAETFYEIAMKLGRAYYRYGLSATPWRSDRSDLMIEAALGEKLCVVSSTHLIEKGYLVPPKITMYEVLPTRKKLPRKYATVYKSEVVEHLERNRLIAEVAEHMSGKGKTVLILVNQVKHGKNLETAIENATFIHGKDSSAVRNEALERLRERSDRVLIATTLADEGLDLPSLDVLILAGAGKSETRALQRVGRVLRPYKGKKQAIVVDFYDQTLYLEEHSKHRFEIYQTEPAFEVDIRPPRKPGQSRPRQRILAEN